MKTKKILLLSWFVICLIALTIMLFYNIDAILNVIHGTSKYYDATGEHIVTLENFSILGWVLNTLFKSTFCIVNAIITFKLFRLECKKN